MRERYVVEKTGKDISKIGDEGQFSLNPFSKVIGTTRERIVNTLNFYASYHQNPVNQKIHTVCIPLLVWTSMVWLSSIPFPLTENVTKLLAIGYCLGYSFYDLKLGAASAVFLGMFAYTAGLFADNMANAGFLALILHGMAWAAQIYGHAQFEGNRPALTDSLLQSLYIAPLFSLIEACDFLGIKKSPLVVHSIFQSKDKNLSSKREEIVENETEQLLSSKF